MTAPAVLVAQWLVCVVGSHHQTQPDYRRGVSPALYTETRSDESTGSARFQFSYKPEVKCYMSTKYMLKIYKSNVTCQQNTSLKYTNYQMLSIGEYLAAKKNYCYLIIQKVVEKHLLKNFQVITRGLRDRKNI